MKANILLLFLVLGIISGTRGQNTLDLSFTAVDNAAYVQLDSIKLMNRTRGNSVMVYWPDTTIAYDVTPGDLLLYIGYAMGHPFGIETSENRIPQFQLFECYPNPVRGQGVISMSLPSKGTVNIMVADIRGRVALSFDRELHKGIHSFAFHPGDESVYFLTTRWHGISKSIRIMNEGEAGGNTCSMRYTGNKMGDPVLKQPFTSTDLVIRESGILDSPAANKTYTFQFATNIPCPGTPTVEYEGLIYNTIQIFSQCWLKENLNVGNMINGSLDQTDNSIKEKYCYEDNADSCTKYGGLYQWNEMMQYTTQQGTQGICPPDWHLPTDEEWKVLEGAADSRHGIGDPEWDLFWEYRGYDAGKNMKTIGGWTNNGNGADLFLFSALPGGHFNHTDRFFRTCGREGYWWASTYSTTNSVPYRNLDYNIPGVTRFKYYKWDGLSVRCLRNY